MKTFNTAERLIRSLVRNVLSESSSPVAKADAEGLAVLITPYGVDPKVIVYDPAKMQSYLDSITADGKDINEIYPAIMRDLGVIRASVVYISNDEPCNDAASVAMSVSFEGSGMGPAAYDIAMWHSKGGLTSDRADVSQSARSVWKKYNKRTDIEKTEFDNIEKPKTLPTEDDCTLHKGMPELNKSYKILSKPVGLDSMIARHNEFLDKTTADGVKHLNSQLGAASRMLFSKRFGR